MFAPRALLFVGVAGALRADINLGDVLVATKVYAYHGGTDTDEGFLARPRAWEVSHELDRLARHIWRAGTWTRLLKPESGDGTPAVHFKPLAAGEVILNSRDTALAHQLRRNYNDAAAIEMEGAGILLAGQLNHSLPVLIVRGISDRADGSKYDSDRAGWQPIAAAHAAAFALTVAATHPLSTAARSRRRPVRISKRTWVAVALIILALGAIPLIPWPPDPATPRASRERSPAGARTCSATP